MGTMGIVFYLFTMRIYHADLFDTNCVLLGELIG